MLFSTDKTSDDVTSSDDPYVQLMTKTSVTETAENVQVVTSITISRNGQNLATISQNSPVKHLIPDVMTTGHLNTAQGERGMLQLTWPHPSQTEAAHYQCDVTTLSVKGHGVTFSQTLNVAEGEASLNDLVSKLHQLELEKENMQLIIANQAKTIHDNQISVNKTIAEQATTITEMNNTIVDQAKTIREHEVTMNKTFVDQAKIIEELKLADKTMTSEISAVNQSVTSLLSVARLEPNVFFSAVLSSGGYTSLTKDKVIVFDQVISNEGNAYNKQNGIFTCPLDGFYSFEIHAFPKGK